MLKQIPAKTGTGGIHIQHPEKHIWTLCGSVISSTYKIKDAVDCPTCLRLWRETFERDIRKIDTYIAFQLIEAELSNQSLKWGDPYHEPHKWMTILVEEIGEAAKAVNEGKLADFKKELIQIAAVCINAVNQIDEDDTHG